METSRHDWDAIVIGAGHNGLITAAYLARAGMRTLLVEARSTVGGTASSERFAGATVNICNCDHVTFRTTPIADELHLGEHGLIYDDLDPLQHHTSWDDPVSWNHHRDLDATLDSIGTVLPGEVDGYRRYANDAIPAVGMIFEAANEVPSIRSLTKLALRRRLAGVPTLLRWSRRSAADVLRSYFSHPALAGTGAVGGPMVWGISPETPGTGLGALPNAMRHVATLGRPRGGSGALPASLLSAFQTAGGEVRLDTRVTSIMCDGERVVGVELSDGATHHSPVVVSACDPHRTFLSWLNNPPANATSMLERWRQIEQGEGFESKIDAIVTTPPVLRSLGEPSPATVLVAPSLPEIDAGYHLMVRGEMMPRPALMVNVPTVADPTMAPTDAPDHHVLSVEAIYTPYGLRGGWEGSSEPRRWLELLADLYEPGFLDSIVDMRAMTPDRYEREFHLPAGHATSFAGGPLAVFRNKNPELTQYQTAVDGLYLTGAATFPGAGIWGASGRNCAAVIIEQHR